MRTVSRRYQFCRVKDDNELLTVPNHNLLIIQCNPIDIFLNYKNCSVTARVLLSIIDASLVLFFQK